MGGSLWQSRYQEKTLKKTQLMVKTPFYRPLKCQTQPAERGLILVHLHTHTHTHRNPLQPDKAPATGCFPGEAANCNYRLNQTKNSHQPDEGASTGCFSGEAANCNYCSNQTSTHLHPSQPASPWFCLWEADNSNTRFNPT